MGKKITSVIKINNNDVKLKIGTVDKKNPTVVYFEGGFYVKPTVKKESYLNDIDEIKEELNKFVKNYIDSSEKIKKDYMFFTDIAEERIRYNKKSFLTFQLYVKPNDTILETNKTFKNVALNLTEEEKLVKEFKEILEKNGFATSKTKS